MSRTLMVWMLLLLVLVPVAGLFLLRVSAREPDHRSVAAGALSDCPSSPNCVSSMAADDDHHIEPLRIEGPRQDVLRQLKAVLATMPRMRVVAEEGGYLHAEATSLFFRFVDDIEFLSEEGSPVVHVRSASRVGYHDLGANRARVERIRKALAAPGTSRSPEDVSATS